MRFVLGSLLGAMLAAAPAWAGDLVPFERFTLPNGLRVIVHEDRKAPIVAVRVAYHVGSKDEPPGKTGFAHLFEHLMFRGSGNLEGNFFDVLHDAGASDINGVTTQDTTQYYQTVPTPALERVLWLESDRMGYLLGKLTEETLSAERAVVRNEKRDREGGPLGALGDTIRSTLYPPGHPYRHSVLGSMEDLEAATLDDVKSWFRTYYGATNTIVVLAGDIDVARARELTEKYFGEMPPGEPLRSTTTWVATLPGDIHQTIQAKVPQGSISWFWPVAASRAQDSALLAVAARVLGERMERQKLGSGISVGMEKFELAGLFSLVVSPAIGTDVALIQGTVEKELAAFLREGPASTELKRIKNDLEAMQGPGLQSVAEKAELLATAELLAGSAAFVEENLRWTIDASTDQVREAARRWLGKPGYRLTVQPFGEYRAAVEGVDRSTMPAVGGEIALDLPPMQEATLSSGLKIVLAERHEVPALSMAMVFRNAGADASPHRRAGAAVATCAVMNAGPSGGTKAEYFRKLRDLHVQSGFGAGSRDITSDLSVPKKSLRAALHLWSRTVREPAFRDADLQTWRDDSLQAIAQERMAPRAIANRVLRQALYPPDHPLAPPSDPEAIVRGIAKEDLQTFHRRWIRPDNATLLIVGDTDLPEIVRELERAFGRWKAPSDALPVLVPMPPVSLPVRPRFILIDSRDREQTQIVAGRLAPAGSYEARLLYAANAILGGATTARLGQRLRVENGWSYGISSATYGELTQQYWSLDASVQSDRVAPAIREILDVITRVTGPEPITQAELDGYVAKQSRGLPAMFENADAVLAAMVQSDANGRPYDWAEGTASRLRALSVSEVNRVARTYFTPQSFTWVLVGDLALFEDELRGLVLGDVEVRDSKGNRVR